MTRIDPLKQERIAGDEGKWGCPSTEQGQSNSANLSLSYRPDGTQPLEPKLRPIRVYESEALGRGDTVALTLGDEDSVLASQRPVQFQTLYSKEFARQVRRATLLVGSSDTANDIVQEAFVQLYQRWDRVKEPGPYLHRSVLNGCRDHGRRQARARNLTARLRSRTGDTATDEILWDVLADLPFNHRAAVVLRYYAGMTETEIAEQLGCRPGSVGPWIRRGLNKMRKALQ